MDDVHKLRPFQSQGRRLLKSHELDTLGVHRRDAASTEQERSRIAGASVGCGGVWTVELGA
jgi:hypothetical protein